MAAWPQRRADEAFPEWPDDKAVASSRTREARRRALAVALMLAVFGALLARAQRLPGIPCLTLGAALGIVGLTVWSIYQLLSRRTDGILLLGLPLLLVVVEQQYSTLRVLAHSLVLVPVVAFAAALLRRPEPDNDELDDHDEEEDEGPDTDESILWSEDD